MRKRETVRVVIAAAGYGAVVSLGFYLAFLVSGCPKPPIPPPNHPDASDAASPAPIVEPGPVPAGDVTKCAVACRHADEVCPGALSPCTRGCARAGGADPELIPCLNGVQDCASLKSCDPLAKASR